MSGITWILLAVLLVSPFYEASETTDILPEARVLARQRRSVFIELSDLVKIGTDGRDPMDFVSYGRFCGSGGSGHPVDSLDQCCFNHDMCYDVIINGSCIDERAYFVNYQYHKVNNGTSVVCDDYEHCQHTLCQCDKVFADCLRQFKEYFDEGNKGMKYGVPKGQKKTTGKIRKVKN